MALLWLGAGAWRPGLAAQVGPGDASAAALRVRIANNSGPPGSTVVLPVYATPRPSLQIGSVKLTVNYPSAGLQFQKAEPGPTVKSRGWKLAAAVVPGDDAASTLLTIQASASDARALGAGILAYLSFRIDEKATPGMLKIATSAEATVLPDGAAVAVSTAPAQIEVKWVDAPPNVSCFFFTH